MSFGQCRFRELECLTCSTVFRRPIWRWDDPADPRNSELQNECPNPSCDQAHIRFRPSQNSSSVQVRAEQRAVVYQFPDGTWAQPGTNDPNDPVAQTCIRDGAVRREFYHTAELREFQRSLAKGSSDELTGYNDVIDMDEASRRSGSRETLDEHVMRAREERLRQGFELVGGKGSAGRYERALEAARRRNQ